MKATVKAGIAIAMIVVLSAVGWLVYRKVHRDRQQQAAGVSMASNGVLKRVPRDAFVVAQFQAKRALALPVWLQAVRTREVQRAWKSFPGSCLGDGTTGIDEVLFALRGAGRDNVQSMLVLTGAIDPARVKACLAAALSSPWIKDEGEHAGRAVFTVHRFAWMHQDEWRGVARGGDPPTRANDVSEQWTVTVESGRMVIADALWSRDVMAALDGIGATAEQNEGLVAAQSMVNGDLELRVLFDSKALQTSAPELWDVVPFLLRDLPGVKSTDLPMRVSSVRAVSAVMGVAEGRAGMEVGIKMSTASEVSELMKVLQPLWSTWKLGLEVEAGNKYRAANERAQRMNAEQVGLKIESESEAGVYQAVDRIARTAFLRAEGDLVRAGSEIDVAIVVRALRAFE